LAGVVTVVDAVNGLAALEGQWEAVKQVAVADRLVVSKTDLLSSPANELMACLAAINPSARQLTASFGEVDADRLFDMGLDDSRILRDATAWLGSDEHSSHGGGADRHHHHSEISTFTIVAQEPIHAVTLTLLLEVLAEHCGGDLLRMKGIVNVAECPERPAVIHGVQHLFRPPTWLPAWPSLDRRSRLVFIVRGIPQAWIEALLEALETEVREATLSTSSRLG
jgi:G3E family GTPase